MALLRERIVSGQASLWERLRYRAGWVRYAVRTVWRLVRILRGRGGEAHGFGFDIPRATALDAEMLEEKLRLLAELFPGVDRKALRDLLQKSRFPAENLLREFLKLVKLPSLYACLNYDYLQDFGPDELREDGIVQIAELRFAPGE